MLTTLPICFAELIFVQIYGHLQMKKIGVVLSLVSLLALSSCDYQKNNRIKQDDVNDGNERVYGDGKGKPARQLANQYEASAEDAARPVKIKEKLYGK